MKREELMIDEEKALRSVKIDEEKKIRKEEKAEAVNAPEEEDGGGPLTIEETFEELDNLLEMLEQSESSLEASFRYFERGMKLVKQCSAQIDKVEKQIILLSDDEEMQ